MKSLDIFLANGHVATSAHYNISYMITNEMLFYEIISLHKIEKNMYQIRFIFRYLSKIQSHYRPEVPRWFQLVKVPRLHDKGPGWW